MYTSILHQFTEKAIQDLLGKSSTPKVVKSSSDYELKLDNDKLDNPPAGQMRRTNLFDVAVSDQQNIVTRGSLLLRPKTLDIKSKINPQLTKINENGKLDDSVESESDVNNHSLTSSLYYSIKEEQEETDNDCTIEEPNKTSSTDKSAGDRLNSRSVDLSNDKDAKLVNQILSTKDVTLTNHATTKNNSTIETIVLDDSSIDNTVRSLENVSINDKANRSEPIVNKSAIEQHNGIKHDPKEPVNDFNNDADQQLNCLFVKNLHYNVGDLMSDLNDDC